MDWHGELLDLDTYLARIGVEGALPPTSETLRTLIRAHALAIPFENLEIVLGRPVPLELEQLQAKMVRSARGGYCYEHVTLFAAVLERLGFGVTGLSARVRMGTGLLRPATHALLLVAAADGRWICDVGFGYGLLEPLAFADGAETTREKWIFRLARGGEGEWLLYAREPAGLLDLHSFTLDPRYGVDYVVLNHYVSTHPRSPFVGRLMAQCVRPEVRHVLDDTTLTSTRTDGSAETVTLEPGEVPKALEEVFGIVLNGEDTARLVAVLARKPVETDDRSLAS
jgi:N-hydroxyarylamine O-acetyltransferase